jgi:hypothetical protein
MGIGFLLREHSMPQTFRMAVVFRGVGRPWRWPIALLVGLALSGGMLIEAQAATTWTVCASGCDYSSIKSAIAAPTTVDGDTLAIGAGTYTEPGITVTKSLILQGASAASTIVQAAATQGTVSGRVFTIPSGVTVTIHALTIQRGSISSNAYPNNQGGGLYNAGTLTLSTSTVRDNSTTLGGGLYNAGTLTLSNSTVYNNSAPYGYGGGLYNAGTLTLTTSTVRDNWARNGGGGFYNTGTLTLLNSTISGNSAPYGYGGGVDNEATLTLTTSTISGNSAYAGGGLYNTGCGRPLCIPGTLTLTTSTISGNRGNTTSGFGGGLSNQGTLMLTTSTISGNSAAIGGGLYNDYHSTLISSTISDNSASTGGGFYNAYYGLTLTSITSSIVANNLDGKDCAYEVALSSHGYNLDSDGSCDLTAPTDQPRTDPLLGSLQKNGGRTLTQALLPGSSAIDAIPWGTNGCGTTLIGDQRWRARPQPAGGACDIGAYEVAVAGQALGGWVTGLTPHTVICQNVTTGQAVTLSDPTLPWDCEAAGVEVSSGDQVALQVRGPMQTGASDVGGAVVGMAPSGGGCTNRTTGQAVKFEALFQGQHGATAASCVAAGLKVHPGETVQLRVQGAAE